VRTTFPERGSRSSARRRRSGRAHPLEHGDAGVAHADQRLDHHAHQPLAHAAHEAAQPALARAPHRLRHHAGEACDDAGAQVAGALGHPGAEAPALGQPPVLAPLALLLELLVEGEGPQAVHGAAAHAGQRVERAVDHVLHQARGPALHPLGEGRGPQHEPVVRLVEEVPHPRANVTQQICR